MSPHRKNKYPFYAFFRVSGDEGKNAQDLIRKRFQLKEDERIRPYPEK